VVREILTATSATAGVLDLAVGAVLLLAPEVLRADGRWRRWLLEIDLTAPLDRRRTVERPLYRHHRAFGAAVIAGALVSLATLWELRNDPLMTGVFPEILGAWGGWAMILAAWMLTAFALGIGVFVLIRPSALKKMETAANRWIEPFQTADRPGGPAVYGVIGGFVLRLPRLAGLLLLASGLACLILLD
jgi:hypothetical protein